MATRARKRRETFGMLDKLPSGRYRARYTDPDGRLTDTGQPVRYAAPSTFGTLTDARAWLAARQAEIAVGTWQPPAVAEAARAAASVTLAEYAETWMSTNRNRKGEPLRPRTIAEYKRLLRAPDPNRPGDKGGPLAELAALPLADITAERVDTWYDAQSRTGRVTQASRAYSLASTILAHAVDRGRIPVNPCRVRGAQTARTGRKVEPPTDDQLDAVLAALDPRWRALIWIAAEGGLRWGEATELRRDDVTVERTAEGDVDRVLITVERAVVRTDGSFTVGRPKSDAGARAVYVYGDAADAIAEHLRAHVSRFGNPLLFPAIGDTTGERHLSQSTFHTPTWDDARRAAGRPDMPFHALRHRAGTAYVQHGATMAEAMSRLGHSSLRVAARYQHATGRDAELAARMARRRTS